ncbi:hypothetical protein NM208_g4768 [Fusarium decemcellulare]|uniref:Uncharacterized protein n=1 Tax=Fusarium decemcellulare TaxID=57161 RepID=A0ACC1SJG8_9HYPO|nr:hypothetical protein NM208_g4768 [Fusarium decemcellulare]
MGSTLSGLKNIRGHTRRGSKGQQFKIALQPISSSMALMHLPTRASTGKGILKSDNMSHSYVVEVKMRPSASNTLVIDFESALLRGRDLEKDLSEHRFAHKGESSCLDVRKAQYHWTGIDIDPTINKTNITVSENGTSVLISGYADNDAEETHVLAARISQDGTCISRDVE